MGINSLGETGRGERKGILPSTSMTARSPWIDKLEIDKELRESLWVRVKGMAGERDIVVGICYRMPDQED